MISASLPVNNQRLLATSMGKILKRIFFSLSFQILLTAYLSPKAQAIQFENLNREQGLSSNVVYDITQDHRGFMWFATQDGLNRFDGYKCKVYKYSALDSSSIAVNWCQSLHEDKWGLLWIGTLYGGLNLYDSATEKFIAFKHDPENPASISNDVVLAICEDDAGNLWLGTWDGLNQLVHNNVRIPNPKKTQFIRYKHDPNNPNSLSDNRIWELFRDQFGIIWIGTDSGGLNRFDPQTATFKRYQYDPDNPNSIKNNRVKCIYEDPAMKRRTLWIGTHGSGLYKFDVLDEAFNFEDLTPLHFPKTGWGPNHVFDVQRDNEGNLWIATCGGLKKHIPQHPEQALSTGVWYRANQLKRFSLKSNLIKELFKDRTGSLWAGTIEKGVSKITSKKKNFINYNARTLGANNIGGTFSVYVDQAGFLYLGSGRKIFKIDRSKMSVTVYKTDSKLGTSFSSNEIYTIYEEPDCQHQTFWVLCREGGLDKLIIQSDPASGTENVIIHHILPNPSDTTSYAIKKGLSLIRDRNGIFWIGADKGLFQFDPSRGKVTQYQANPDDPRTFIRDRVDKIYQSPYDSAQIFWLGTANGLYRVDGEQHQIDHYTPEEGKKNCLNDFRVIALLADAPTRGKILWIGTFSGGLNQFDRGKNTFKHFTEKDGLPSNTIYSILQDDVGNLWLGTQNGLAKFDRRTERFNTYNKDDGLFFDGFYPGGCFKSPRTGEMFFGGMGVIAFHPDSIIDNSNIPAIVLTNFKVFNQPLPLDTSITQIKTIQLSHQQNFFTIEFAGLEYSEPEKHQYAYLLEGVDKDWVYCGNRRSAYYTNVSGGEYIFRVKGSNNDGVWNEKGTSVKIIITPPFWETWWFRILALFMIFGLAGLIISLRISILVKERDFQRTLSKRLIEEVDKSRKRIARELHDSLGQNLLIVKNEIQQMILSFSKKNQSPEALREISAIVSESIDEVRALSTNLHPHQLERFGLKAAIKSIINKLSYSTEIKFSYKIADIDPLFQKEEMIHVFRILQEGLNNILKHSAATQVTIQIENVNHRVNIRVEDNGKGFDLKKKSFTVQSQQGFGLNGMKERVKILNGQFRIQTAPGKGTRLSIQIPINPSFRRSPAECSSVALRREQKQTKERSE